MAWGTEQEARLSRAQQWPLNTCTSFPSPKFHCDKYRVQFFVQGASTAHALKDVSYKMCDEDGQKVGSLDLALAQARGCECHLWDESEFPVLTLCLLPTDTYFCQSLRSTLLCAK